MKKRICVLGVFFCCMLCVIPAQADTIWEPQDSFYEDHASECTYEGRTYTANGPDGVVILYASPLSDRKIDTWENGFEAYISFTYEDKQGTLWGVYEQDRKSGWMPMEYMDVVYDHISFEQEYGAEIQEMYGTLNEQYMGKEILLWEYPGSPYQSAMTVRDRLPYYHTTYEDSVGHLWGSVGYYYGYKDVWICLDKPDGGMDALYPDTAPGIGESQPVEKEFDGERITPQGREGNVAALAAVMVLAVVLVTGGLLFALKKRGGGGGSVPSHN